MTPPHAHDCLAHIAKPCTCGALQRQYEADRRRWQVDHPLIMREQIEERAT